MGCFDSTCPISGLAIKRDDPVKWSLITDSGEWGDLPWGGFQFFIPLFDGTYNEAGTVEWESIAPKDSWQWLWKKLKLTIQQLDDKYKYPLSNNDEDIFDDLAICRRRCLYYNKLLGKIEVTMWMCHKWAFDYLRDLVIDNNHRQEYKQEILDHVAAYVQRDNKLIGMSNERKRYITGSHGLLPSSHDFYYFCNQMENDGFDLVKDQYSDLLYESTLFFHNLYFIRKKIHPMMRAGAQYEEYTSKLPEWLEFVTNKSKQWVKQRREDLGCDCEDD